MEYGNWRKYISYDESRGYPQIDRTLLGRMLGYAKPYWLSVLVVLSCIIAISLVELIPPLLVRELIDNVLSNRDFSRLNVLALGMIGIPIVSGLISVLLMIPGKWNVNQSRQSLLILL